MTTKVERTRPTFLSGRSSVLVGVLLGILTMTGITMLLLRATLTLIKGVP